MSDDPSARSLTYLRVSSQRQMNTAIDIDADGNSIATQRDFTSRKARNLDTVIRREFLEPGNSAQTIEKRPVFQEMIRFIKDHPGEIDYVIIYQRSRAFRNVLDAGVTEHLLKSLNIKLVSAKEDFGEGIMGDAMKTMMDVFNEMQVRLSGEDIKTKMEHKARSGGTISRARIGYRNVRIDVEGRQVNSIAVDSERAPLVLKVFELYASGEYTIEGLTEAMAELGLTTRPSARWSEKPVSDKQLRRILEDPYYLGYVVYKGDMVPGRHEAIVPQSLFDQVQDVLAARSTRGQRDRVHDHYLKGMLFCGRCEQQGRRSRLIYTEARNRWDTVYAYFMCKNRHFGTCDMPHLRVERVEDAIEALYHADAMDEEFREALTADLRSTMAGYQEHVQQLTHQLRKQLARIDVQEDRLLDLASDGTMPTTKLRAKLNTLVHERDRIKESLAAGQKELAIGVEVVEKSLELMENPARLYAGSPLSVRRYLNETFYEHFVIDEFGAPIDAPGNSVFGDLRSAEQAYLRLKRPERSDPAPDMDAVWEAIIKKSNPRPSGSTEMVKGSTTGYLVELWGFEPQTPSMRTRCATGLRHSPVKRDGPARGPT